METLNLTVHPRTPFGAVIEGVDLRQELPEQVKEQLRDAWRKHALLVFPRQELDREQQRRVAEVFGPCSEQGVAPGGVTFITNLAERGIDDKGEMNLYSVGELRFHFDNSFYEEPLKGIMLYAMELPPPGNGGDTLFSDARNAYKLLPDAFRAKLAGMKARYHIPHDGVKFYKEVPIAEHPILNKHPETGEDILFLSRRHAESIVGVPKEEGEKLMDEISDYIERPENILRHVWEPHDLVVFDNMAIQHARTDYDPKFKRHLRRIQIGWRN